MPRDYRITIETPGGVCSIEGDDWDVLILLLPSKMAESLTSVFSPNCEASLDDAANMILDAYRDRYGQLNSNHGPSRVAEAGWELDLVRCYLQGLTIADARGWLKTRRGFDCSQSAVGRYWTRLFEITKALRMTSIREGEKGVLQRNTGALNGV